MTAKKLPWLDRTVLRSPYLLMCTTEAMYKQAMKHLSIDDPDEWISTDFGATCHTFYKPGRLTCVVCMRPEKGRHISEIAGLLAHEAVHVKQKLFASINEDAPGTEIEAYAVQNIFQELLYSYMKQTNRK